MGYTYSQEDAIRFLRERGLEYRVNGGEYAVRRCPYCGGGRSGKDEWTFALNIEKGVFRCLRASCDAHGHFVELARDFDFPLGGSAVSYRPLAEPTEKKPLSEEALRYFAERGIESRVVARYGVYLHGSRADTLVFPCCDQDGTLRTVKYRDMNYKKGCGAKEWFERGTMPVLFGMNLCKGRDRLIITEGQIDAMSLAQAGIKNAVSVPGGMGNFRWWEPCAEWVNSFREIVVFGDWENGRMTLLEEILRRAKTAVKAVRRQDYLCEKDANDILVRYGPQALVKCVENAVPPAVENVVALADVADEPVDAIEKAATYLPELDRLTGGLVMGELIVLSGERGSGKSTLMSQMICAALDQGLKVFAYSGELSEGRFKYLLDCQLAGEENLSLSGGSDAALVPPGVERAISEWYRERMLLYRGGDVSDEGVTPEALCDTVEQAILSRRVKAVFIDNLMTVMEGVGDQNSLYLRQSRFAGRLKRLAMRYNVCVVLVAHVRKKAARDRNLDFASDDVSGSADITNKADVVLHYTRLNPAPGDRALWNGLLNVTKNRLFGQVCLTQETGVKLRFLPASRRLISVSEQKPRRYGWEAAEQMEMTMRNAECGIRNE